MISSQNKMIDLRYRYYLYMSDMMLHMLHHGSEYNKRVQGNTTSALVHRSSSILGMDDTIHKEVMNRENYSPDEVGDSMVSGWKIVKEIIEFLAFILIFILTISLGTLITIGVVGVVFFMYIWDTSKYFWKNIKNT